MAYIQIDPTSFSPSEDAFYVFFKPKDLRKGDEAVLKMPYPFIEYYARIKGINNPNDISHHLKLVIE